MTALTHAGSAPQTRRLPVPRTWPIHASDTVIALSGLGALVMGMWVIHGGLSDLGTLAAVATGLGQLTALVGTYLALVGILLMARVPWLDHVIGSDRLMAWHRWLGAGVLAFIGAHVALTTLGWSMSSGAAVIDEFLSLNQTWDVLAASLGTLLILAVSISSIRLVRRRLSYETWYGLHLYAYLGVALAFSHQLSMGADFLGDRMAVWFWVGLYVVTFGLLLWYRVLTPIRTSARHRLRVASVMRESPSVVSVYLVGRDLDRLAIHPGQFFHVRFLHRGGWWRPHPLSISAAPNREFLRFTIKDVGDDSHRMMTMPVGTPVFIEGPYGAFTAQRLDGPRVVMLAGGVGVTPLRSILEGLTPGQQAVSFLYREGDAREVLFADELRTLAAWQRVDLRFLVGHRGSPEMPADPLAPEWLERLVPDLAEADVMICGSRSFTECVLRSLDRLGVPPRQIHAERFGY